MATPGAEFVTLRRKTPALPGTAEGELRELEKEITSKRDQPASALLRQVVERVNAITGGDGAAIAVRDPSGVICRASVGDAPQEGSRLQPDSALTRECFETGQVVICEDTDTDYRVHRSTAKSLGLRSAVVVPLKAEGPVQGVLEVLSSRPSAFNPTQVDGLQRIGTLLAQVLASAPEQSESPDSEPPKSESPRASVLAFVPPPSAAPANGSEEIVLAPVSTLAAPAEPKSGVDAFLVAGAALLLLLLVVYFAVVHESTAPSATTVAPASAPEKPAAQSPGARPSAHESQPVGSERSPSPATPRTATSALPVPSLKSGTEPPAAPGKPPAIETQAAPVIVRSVIVPSVILPVVPALVIQGAPPGTQVFVDDKLVASTSSNGQTSISALGTGQHRLRLTLNGYRDYDSQVDVQTDKTSTITAKLEPLNLPVLNGSPTIPVLSAAALPSPVIATRPSPPDFVLDRTLKAHTGWVTGVAFSPDGQKLVSGSWDRTVKFWEVSTGEQVKAVSGKMKEVQALAFSRDGQLLATENSSNTATLRDSTTGQEIRAFPSDKPLGVLGSNWVYSIAFSPDGQWLASGVDDKTVRLWDIKTGQKVRDLAGLRRQVIYIAFSPDGRLLATGDGDKNISIWDVSKVSNGGEEIYKLRGHKKPVHAVAFSPNGRWLASASGDKTVKLWDMNSGREVHTLAGHGNSVTSLAFSPDGRWLASGSWDKTIKIWDVETGGEVQTLSGHDHPIYSVAFGPRGRWLASGSEDGTIKLWRLADSAGQSTSRQ
ncbi:MAG TPA: GAF domain-containing protein [Terriglobales bacterium]|nr:GAF domain-containing protein [Terriglobales bacterium]